MRGSSIPKETLGFAEGKEMLFGGMCGQYMRVDGESEKVCVNVGHAEWSLLH